MARDTIRKSCIKLHFTSRVCVGYKEDVCLNRCLPVLYFHGILDRIKLKILRDRQRPFACTWKCRMTKKWPDYVLSESYHNRIKFCDFPNSLPFSRNLVSRNKSSENKWDCWLAKLNPCEIFEIYFSVEEPVKTLHLWQKMALFSYFQPH